MPSAGQQETDEEKERRERAWWGQSLKSYCTDAVQGWQDIPDSLIGDRNVNERERNGIAST